MFSIIWKLEMIQQLKVLEKERMKLGTKVLRNLKGIDCRAQAGKIYNSQLIINYL